MRTLFGGGGEEKSSFIASITYIWRGEGFDKIDKIFRKLIVFSFVYLEKRYLQ